ncbi:MAG: GNAT family N-acetyltransferase [Candidatus Omnitrophota bacterium]
MEARKFCAEDGGKVKELILSILEKEYPFDRKAYSDTDLDSIGEVYGGPREIFYVIDVNGRLVGTAGIKEDSKEVALLRRVFVDPKERRKGYGSLLLEETIRFCKKMEYRHLVFRTTSKMEQAILLCKKKGFAEKEKLDLGGFSIHKFELDL